MENDPNDFQEVSTEQENCAENQKLISDPTALTIQFLFRWLAYTGWPATHPQECGDRSCHSDTAALSSTTPTASPTPVTKQLLCSRFVWSGINGDIPAWTKDCAKCQQSNIHQHVHVKPLPIPVPQRRFAHIHIDLVGPLTISLGHIHILTIIDRTSRWMEAIPLTNTATTDVEAALFSGWISRFGVPDTIASDRGPQFTSNIWNSLCLLLQIKNRQTTAYHPQAKGMVERLHCCLKDALQTPGG
jgi:hypothetical protein